MLSQLINTGADQPAQTFTSERNARELRPHPLNETIYGDRADGDLIASVRARGVLNPILITQDNFIISGHRRWGAAIAAGLSVVPVVVFGSTDPLDIEEALIESNRQRQKTNYQLAAEYTELKRIKNQRASRQGSNQYTPKTASVSQDTEAQPPREQAAEELGISPMHAHRIETVREEIDDLIASGNETKAQLLREELERSAKAAYEKVRGEQRRKQKELTPELPLDTPRPIYVRLHNADSRHLDRLAVEPAQLVITSPPYNVGIDYATHDDTMDEDEYEDMLLEVFGQCNRIMVDGARIAVVVPLGVGRNPWRPFAPNIMRMLEIAGFTLRGQIIWDKGNSGNRTSWGSFRLPSDPSLRDTTEAIVVAHKGSGKLPIPDTAKTVDAKGTHTEALRSSEYFMQLAQDHWVVAPESASRVGHPAPFPIELARRLIDFYAYPGAHILDPFAGSGTTGVAAAQAGCYATLVELSATYCEIASRRLGYV